MAKARSKGDAISLADAIGQKRALTRTAPTALHEQVFDRLRDAVIEGQLAPGRALTVRGLAAEFDVSTMPAREAIRRLVAMGALELTSTRRLSVATMTDARLEEISVARLALEPDLAKRACLLVSGDARRKKKLIDELSGIDRALDAAIAKGDAGEYARQNSRFHMAFYRASEAVVLLGLVESLWLRFGPFMRVVVGRIGTSGLDDDKHKVAISCLNAGDADGVEEAIRTDIQEGLENIGE